jgi:hypothetical protein
MPGCRVGPVFVFTMITVETTALVAPWLLVCSVSKSPITPCNDL